MNFPYMCREGHAEIGYRDDGECPLCELRAVIRAYLAAHDAAAVAADDATKGRRQAYWLAFDALYCMEHPEQDIRAAASPPETP